MLFKYAESDSYCHICKWGNQSTIFRKIRDSRSVGSKEAFLQDGRIRELEEQLRFEKIKNSFYLKFIAAKDEEYMSSKTMTGKLIDDDEYAFVNSPLAEG